VAVAVVVLVGVVWLLSRWGGSDSPPAEQVASSGSVPVEVAERMAAEPASTEPASSEPGSQQAPEPTPRMETPVEVPQPAAPAPTPARIPDTEPEPAPEEAPEEAPTRVEPALSPPALTVDSFGVGEGIVDRRLQGESDRFEEGKIAWFFTRVLGGGRGEGIRHVWLRDGAWVQTIELRVGGPHWRTHSSKTLWGTGSWAVEARDSDGRVLARSTFECVPAGS
jgi:hypothetical protein